ncbi:TetR/AcrR family transcriptional regulator [Conexibacter sp. JD483]|uniref:TetR/AcrR family transcriptional regulator n=1 Tax=unclassified Conexibacter TaxID=2627773 RepID=UPI002716268F|nr:MULTISPECIES: TetR/AcrR family transcriptional regulator [unclassified Conexibacter]MDO8185236.1 TetR/AcrR family transcriptional regulator [Conexibacter sp. CPCC 205706]MDO8198282.1 TetR/AcrR family transcriptional regulator [Conexibacter sp. CPCC 205762]MDR9367756.1 TetR/AcrR family transcriptional regulator [Conexibacter sp. JD483]
MSSETVTTKERIVYAAADLFRRHGYAGTGMRQVVAAAQAPFGSLYHHFPGGKEQLGEEVIRVAGGMYGQLVAAILDSGPGDLVAATEQAFALAAQHLEESGWEDACPIATITLEVASTSEPMRIASAEVFEQWLAALSARFTTAGIDAPPARELALAWLMLLEGGFLFCRAARTREALLVAGRQAAAAVAVALTAR